MAVTSSRAQALLNELSQELRDHPPPVGFDRIRTDLDEALTIIDKLLNRLDIYYTKSQKGRWVDRHGNAIDSRQSWLVMECFGSDHDLYDAICALRGRNGRKWR